MLEIESSLIELGLTEDGDRIIREEFYVTFSTPNGVVYVDSESSFSEGETEARKEKLEGITQKEVEANWRYYRTRYGSQAYVNFGQAEEVAMEKKEG